MTTTEQPTVPPSRAPSAATVAAGSARPVIRVRDMRMAYGGTDVLHGIDLDIRRGEIFALLGPNGAGKTTTVEILEGFRQRSAGEVAVLGTDPARGDDAWRARIGLVLQSWRDHRRWQVAELLRHFALYYPAPRDPAELLALVGLTEQAGQQVDRLSGGQRRRLDVALAIVGRPELLFLDEPTTGFDPEARRDFHDLVERLARDEGVTILLTTHDLAEAERLADRIAVLVNGRIRAGGTRGTGPPGRRAGRGPLDGGRWHGPPGTHRGPLPAGLGTPPRHGRTGGRSGGPPPDAGGHLPAHGAPGRRGRARGRNRERGGGAGVESGPGIAGEGEGESTGGGSGGAGASDGERQA